MKKLLLGGVAALMVVLATERQASAWINNKFSVGLGWEVQSGGNNFFWGLYRNGQPPGPEAYGGHGFNGFNGGFNGDHNGNGPYFGGAAPAAPSAYGSYGTDGLPPSALPKILSEAGRAAAQSVSSPYSQAVLNAPATYQPVGYYSSPYYPYPYTYPQYGYPAGSVYSPWGGAPYYWPR